MNKFTEITAETDAVVLLRGGDESGFIFDGQIKDQNIFFSFSHNNRIWKFNVADTLAKAVGGFGPNDLLMNINGHFEGRMSEKQVDEIVGVCCALISASRQIAISPGGLVS